MHFHAFLLHAYVILITTYPGESTRGRKQTTVYRFVLLPSRGACGHHILKPQKWNKMRPQKERKEATKKNDVCMCQCQCQCGRECVCACERGREPEGRDSVFFNIRKFQEGATHVHRSSTASYGRKTQQKPKLDHQIKPKKAGERERERVLNKEVKLLQTKRSTTITKTVSNYHTKTS